MNIRRRIKEYFLKPLYPWNPKKIRKEYDDRLHEIDRITAWKKSPYKIPWCPWAYYCIAKIDYSKYEKSN